MEAEAMLDERLMALIAEECDDADDDATVGDVMDKARERYYLHELKDVLFFTVEKELRCRKINLKKVE